MFRLSKSNGKRYCLEVFILFAVFLGSLHAFSQHNLRFSNHSNASIYNQVITALDRGTSGLLWVGTQRGLFRYDGIKFRPVLANKAGLDLSTASINAIAIDSLNRAIIWLGTKSGKIVRYNSESNSLIIFSNQNKADADGSIHTFFIDKRSKLWALTSNNTLLIISDQDSTYQKVSGLPPSNGNTPKYYSIFQPEFTPGKLWLGTDHGILLLDVNTYHTKPQPLFQPAYGEKIKIISITESSGKIWALAEDRTLYHFDPHKGSWTKLSVKNTGISETATSIYPSRQYPGVLWVPTRGKGLQAYNTKTASIRQYRSDSSNPSTLSGDDVLSIYEDDASLLWVGTTAGLNKSRLYPVKRFSPVLLSEVNKYPKIGRSVVSVYESPSNTNQIWLSILRDGLYRMDRGKEELQRLAFSDTSKNVIFAMCEDSYGNFWVGGIYNSLFHLDRDTGELTPYPLKFDGGMLITQISVLKNQPEYLWVSAQYGGLYKFNVRTKKIEKRYTKQDGLNESSVYFIQQSKLNPNLLWIVCFENGLNLLNLQTGEIKSYLKEKTKALPTNDILTVLENKDGTLWLGSYDHGLIYFDPLNDTSRVFLKKTENSGIVVPAISKDASGNLWFGSGYNGLYRMDMKTQAFTKFTRPDGIQDNIFHYQAWQVNKKGEILAGGRSGLNIFSPDSIRVNNEKAKTILTNIKINGEDFDLSAINLTKTKLRLSY